MSSFQFIALASIFLHQLYLVEWAQSHGRLLEPPARNTLWRFGFKAPPNYNDNELFCGGIGGITRNEGRCGICGDPYDGLRLHETGHSMALNETTRNYFPGSTIDLMVEIVANHGGRFEFEMCWRNNWTSVETEDCFEPLPLSSGQLESAPLDPPGSRTRRQSHEVEAEENSDYHYELDPASGTGIRTMSLALPRDRECQSCVLRWHWVSANNWGRCADGSEAIGCGYQEVYRNCADVSVKRNGAGIGLGLASGRQRRRRSPAK